MHKDSKSFLGYVEAAPEMAAGLAVAVAAKANRRRSWFVAGVDFDLPSELSWGRSNDLRVQCMSVLDKITYTGVYV